MEAIVHIPTDSVELEGSLNVPDGARGVVVFAHGSGSSRFSPRNTYVAEKLREAGIGTLLFDLLTEREAADRANVFDIPLLARRLRDAAAWVRRPEVVEWIRRGSRKEAQSIRIGYFGASTGAAAALVAAADDPTIGAIVSRGGRPDLAEAVLPKVQAPTLLIVGGEDVPVIRLNREAYERLRCTKELKIVPGAGHLFEEPGALDQVVRLATEWFELYLIRGEK